jgi:hypothetical protein
MAATSFRPGMPPIFGLAAVIAAEYSHTQTVPIVAYGLAGLVSSEICRTAALCFGYRCRRRDGMVH